MMGLGGRTSEGFRWIPGLGQLTGPFRHPCDSRLSRNAARQPKGIENDQPIITVKASPVAYANLLPTMCSLQQIVPASLALYVAIILHPVVLHFSFQYSHRQNG